MATPSAMEMCMILRNALATNVGVVSCTIDGRTVQYDGVDKMTAALDYWEQRAARETGRRRMWNDVKLA